MARGIRNPRENDTDLTSDEVVPMTISFTLTGPAAVAARAACDNLQKRASQLGKDAMIEQLKRWGMLR